MHQTAEVPGLAPSAAPQICHPVNDSCVFGALREWQVQVPGRRS